MLYVRTKLRSPTHRAFHIFIQKLGHRAIRTFDKGDLNIVDIKSANYYKPLPHERL